MWATYTPSVTERAIDHSEATIKNKRGMDCEVSIRRDGNRITIHTENVGIVIDSLTTIKDEIGDVYIALTGDQCSLTNIRVMREAESRP